MLGRIYPKQITLRREVRPQYFFYEVRVWASFYFDHKILYHVPKLYVWTYSIQPKPLNRNYSWSKSIMEIVVYYVLCISCLLLYWSVWEKSFQINILVITGRFLCVLPLYDYIITSPGTSRPVTYARNENLTLPPDSHILKIC